MLKLCTNLVYRTNWSQIQSKCSTFRLYRCVISENLTKTGLNLNFVTRPYFGRSLFLHNENSFAHNVLQSFPVIPADSGEKIAYTVIVSDNEQFERFLDQDWRQKSPSEIVNAFRSVGPYTQTKEISVSDGRFDRLVDGFLDNVEKLTKDEIVAVLEFLAVSHPADGINAHNYHDMWSALDDVCCWRLKEWDNATLFQICELWYKLSFGRICDFVYEVLEKLSKRPDRLSKAELLHAFFYVNVCRKWSIPFSFENAVERIIDDMSSDEMGIVAMGFFKTHTKIGSDKILNRMLTKAREDAETIHEISLTAILKIVRMSQNPRSTNATLALLERITPEINRLSMMCCLHVGIVGTNLHIFHRESLDAVSQRIADDVDNVDVVRLKDIERMLLVCSTFNYSPQVRQGDLVQLFVEQLRNAKRDPEKVKYPKCVSCSLLFLAVKNVYLDDLIDMHLNAEFINELYGRSSNKLPRELFCLDLSLEIDRPDYSGNRIPLEKRYKAAKWLVDWRPIRDKKNAHSSDKLILDVLTTCRQAVGGEELAKVLHVLPHISKPDVILCYDKKSRKFVEPVGFEQYKVGDIMRPGDSHGLKWYAVVPVSMNTMVKFVYEPLGMVKMKLRHLKKIGFEPILVPYNEYLPLDQTSKIDYIMSKILK